MLRLENVGKIYNTNNNVSVGIRKVNLDFHINEFVAITGESGSGKTTLLNVISGIDTYEEGEMYINGEETSHFSTEDLEKYRNSYVGFIFQNYNILDSFTVLQNIEAALMFDKNIKKEDRRNKAIELITRVGLKDKINTKSSKLSGGEKQRAVIARALAKDAPIIAADEPTGNLDSVSSKEIIKLLYEVSKDKLVLIVTHDFEEVKDYATRVIRVYDGEIKEDRSLKEKDSLKDLPPLSLDDTKNRKNDIIKLGIIDSLSSPKKAIFHIFAFFMLSVFFLAAFAIYQTYQNENSISFYSVFSNTDSHRLVVNKKDKTAFTESELSTIRAMNNVDYLIEHDILLDIGANISFYTSNDDYYHNIFNYFNITSSISEDSLKCGNLPIKDDEVVVTIDKKFMLPDMNSFDEALGKTVTVYGVQSKEYKIVGVVDSSNESKTYIPYIYLTESEYFELYLDILFERYVNVKVGDSYFYYNSVEIDNTLTDNQIKLYDETGPIKVHDMYHTLLEGNFEIVENEERTPIIYLNQRNYDLFKDKVDDVYQISIFVNNQNKIAALKTSLKSTANYRSVIASETSLSDLNGINQILAIFILGLLSSFMIAAFFITYATLSHSIKSKKDDFEILRTIGATKEEVGFMLMVELALENLVAYFMIVIIYLVLLLTLKGYSLEIIKTLNFGHFLLLLAVVLIISVLLALLYSKKLFKRSVKKSLEEK